MRIDLMMVHEICHFFLVVITLSNNLFRPPSGIIRSGLPSFQPVPVVYRAPYLPAFPLDTCAAADAVILLALPHHVVTLLADGRRISRIHA